jgi:hypothetical protein
MTVAEGEAATEDGGKKKGGMKGLIIKIVPLLLIGYLIATKTVLKPPPPTAAQIKAKAAIERRELEIKCSLANNKTPPNPLIENAEGKVVEAPSDEEHAGASTDGEGKGDGESTGEKADEEGDAADETAGGHAASGHEPAGPILQMDAVTINLAPPDDEHFLKFRLALQFPAAGGGGHGGVPLEDLEAQNPGVPALDYVLSQLRQKTTKDVGHKQTDHLREDFGYHVCVTPELNAGGQITTVYFTEFVSQ